MEHFAIQLALTAGATACTALPIAGSAQQNHATAQAAPALGASGTARSIALLTPVNDIPGLWYRECPYWRDLNSTQPGALGCNNWREVPMSELIVVAFDEPNKADEVLSELRELQREYLIDLEDAVVAVRRPDGKVQLKQSVNLMGMSAASGGLWGARWGTLVGMLFLNPLMGFALGTMVGAGTGALAGALVDYGINDEFIRELAKTLKPNSSALFILVRKMQPEKVLSDLSKFRGRVLRTSLSPEQEARLQEALSGAAASPPPGNSGSAANAPGAAQAARS
jgi:uncharacterized membrane protein